MGRWVGFLDLKKDKVREVENTIMFCTAYKVLNG